VLASTSPTEQAELRQSSCAQQLKVVSASSLGGLAFHSDCQVSQSQQGGVQPLHSFGARSRCFGDIPILQSYD